MSIVVSCANALAEAIRKVPGFEQRTFVVYSEDEILKETKGMAYPCIGVIYEGMRSIPEAGETNKQGVSGELVCSVLLFFKQDTRATLDAKETALETLDVVRKAIRVDRAPSGHKWKFQLETPVDGKAGVLVYLQRWATPVQNV